MKHLAILLVILCIPLIGYAQKVTVHAVDQPAPQVFRSIIEQTGKNFVYSSDLLKDMRITVNADNQPLARVLDRIFSDTDIEYRIKGKNVALKRKKAPKLKRIEPPAPSTGNITGPATPKKGILLDEVVVTSRLEAPPCETPEIGATKVTAEEVRNTPALFGESDVIKTLHTQPGVIEGAEGVAGMYVHGGNNDENMWMLDNVPLYQANHFAGLFSAFNTDIIRYIDFFKTSIPAKYDGRLSSFMDVRLKNGNQEGHHGSARLGLTSGAFNISGPIGNRTSYVAAVRRSWYDVLTTPLIAIVNSHTPDEKIRLHYYFMDFNAKLQHRFSSGISGFISAYYGNDLLKTGSIFKNTSPTGWYENDKFDFNWGNLVIQAGLNYRINSGMTAELNAAYTRNFSGLKHDYSYEEYDHESVTSTRATTKRHNNINDWIFRGDFDWQPSEDSRIRFGANYIRHSFLPSRTSRMYTFNDTRTDSRDSTWAYGANELNAYIEHDWQPSPRLRSDIGIHTSLFNIEGKTHYGVSPRITLSWRPVEAVALKAAYTRTIQYVHQLTQSYLALPTDQWIPITGSFKPQSADKIAIGGYWQSTDNRFNISLEGYYKFMHHLIDYCDEYYLQPPLEMWNARLTSGRGTAKGIDLKIQKTSGRFTGHISYSLAWADRTFKEKNGGKTFPARFDNRHTINVVANWNISDKISLNAAWTGHSGNRFTLLPQSWESPEFGSHYDIAGDGVALRAPVNNYRLPFYHRLDLSCTVKNSRGYWTFGLYNAYCHLNTIAIRRSTREIVRITPDGINYTSVPVFKKVKLLPIIPSISYTWKF